MNITRHEFDRDRVTAVYEFNAPCLDEVVQQARGKARMLYLSHGSAMTVLQAGSVLCPDAPEVRRALELAAQAGVALFVCQPPGPPPPVELGNGPPVVHDETAPPGLAVHQTWQNAFHLCLIARKPRLSDALCRVPNEVFHGADIIGADIADYGFENVLRAVWMQERFTNDPEFRRIKAACESTPRSVKYIHAITLPYLRTLRYLEAKDEAGFAEALTNGLRGHKAFYSTKKYRQEFGGLVSLMLTGVAALAYDRGLRFDVQSDYMPQSWVTGEVFRQVPPAP